jgi:hypothetical protein
VYGFPLDTVLLSVLWYITLSKYLKNLLVEEEREERGSEGKREEERGRERKREEERTEEVGGERRV